MIARLLISLSPEARVEEIKRILSDYNLTPSHPDLLYFPYDTKLGIEQARKIKNHYSLKPYSAKNRAVVLEDGGELTVEAQNALLKTIEELPEDSLFIMGASSESKLLPTVLSRCEIVNLGAEKYNSYKNYNSYTKDLGHLLKANVEERFEYIEKLKEREEFLHALVKYFHQNLPSHLTSGNTVYKDFLKELLSAEEWQKQNVNIRAILEYLMLVMPKV